MVNYKTMMIMTGILSLTACANQQPAPPPQPDPAIMTISRAVDEIKNERRLLTDSVRQNKPAPAPTNLPNYPEFQQPITLLNWNGPAKEAAKTIAQMIGYQFRISGKPNGIDPQVHLNADGVAAGTLLVELGDQGESVFDIRIDPQQRIMTFIYR